MERKILFKAKRTDNGMWIEGYYVYKKYYRITKEGVPKYEGYKHFIRNDMYGFMLIDENTLCQYTGLTDKNGKKIWENDIVVHSYRRYEDSLDYPLWKSKVHKKNYAIKWDSTYSYCGFRYHNGRNIFPFINGTVINGNDEVIGNIFDNPELLGGGE